MPGSPSATPCHGPTYVEGREGAGGERRNASRHDSWAYIGAAEMSDVVPSQLRRTARNVRRVLRFALFALQHGSPALLATAVITFALAWSEFMFAFILSATPRSQTLPGTSQMPRSAASCFSSLMRGPPSGSAEAC